MPAASTATAAPPVPAPAVAAGRDTAADGLRGLAALTVFYHHLMLAPIQGWTAPRWLTWPVEASAAVLVFFTLSGYVIGLTNPREATGRGVRLYLWRRVVRLVPINTIAVLLSCAAATAWGIDTLVSHLLFLQNFVPYPGAWLPAFASNANLWSLNAEVACYLLFIAVWWWRPRLRIVTAIAIAVMLLGWYTSFVPLFLACYAAGFLFWTAGLALAWRAEPDAAERVNWPAALLLLLVTWKLEALRNVLSALPMPYFTGPTVKLYYLDNLPVVVWLVACVTRRRFPLLRAFKIAAIVIPVAGLLTTEFQPGRITTTERFVLFGLYLLSIACWRWRPSLAVFRWCAPLGLVSFAVYAFSRPIEEFVFRPGQALPPGPWSFALCAAMVTVVTFGLSAYIELRIQPAIHRRLCVRKRG